ncbi:MAG: hypothetical protein IKT32_07320, partial [Clostridia bacterium]|nr:hypothetical protein [Clostridia bacterium]
KIALVSRISSDTIYQESWGEATFAEGFIGRAGETSAITFDGTTYNFTMVDNETGKIPKAEDEPRLFAGMTFKGTIDGQSATLSADGYQTYTLMIAGKQIFKATTYEISSMRNGGTNYVTNEVFLYEADIRDNTFYSYKFKVDPVGKTFELVKRDNLFGYYETDNMYLMLDGYGTGFINFNSKSYYETQFTYTKFNNLVTITYKDTLPDFAYGEGAQFILDDFGNVLSVHSGVGLTVGEAFKNRYIQSGIIVNVNIETIGKESDAVAKAELYRAIEIINANGVVADSEKSSYIETKKVSFGKAGFYQLTIKATVYGETVTAYYSIQVLDPVFSENPLVAVYGAGVIYPEHSLIIDKYGRLTIAVADGTFVGSCRIISDNTFVAQVYGKQGVAKIEGNVIANGLVQIRATGALSYLDYYTTGKSYIVGTETTILRAFELKDQTVFILNKASTSVNGEVVTVELISGTTILSVGSIIKITSTNGDIYAKVLEMGNTKKGLQLEDGCRGTFTGDGEVLVLDGFGKAVYGDEVGTYVMNGIGYVTVYMSDNPTVYSIDTNTGVYTDLKVKFDATLVIGKTFSAEYYFTCDDYIYLANTSFKFDANGKVTVKSLSSEHDGEDGCSLDDYAPVFCSTEGVVGSYSVKGTKVTVTVNGYTFVFNISNVLVCNELVCENNGGLSSDAHGYFASNSIFTIGA